MKNNYSINIKISEDMLKKLLYICDAENRSPSNQFNFMLRNNISYVERTKGKMPEAKLREIDVSDYLDVEKN